MQVESCLQVFLKTINISVLCTINTCYLFNETLLITSSAQLSKPMLGVLSSHSFTVTLDESRKTKNGQ